MLISHLNDSATAPEDESDDAAAARVARLSALRDCLTKLTSTSVPLLTASLEAGSDDFRNHVAGVLGEIGPKAAEAITPLIALLDPSNDTSVRLSAIMAIEKIGDVDPAVTPALLKTQTDKNKKVAKAAKQAISNLAKAQDSNKN